MKVAKAKGRLRGKQPKLSPIQEAHLVGLYRAGEHTVSELEELFGVTPSIAYCAVRRAANGAFWPSAAARAGTIALVEPSGSASAAFAAPGRTRTRRRRSTWNGAASEEVAVSRSRHRRIALAVISSDIWRRSLIDRWRARQPKCGPRPLTSHGLRDGPWWFDAR
jgi:hypothetical protein